MGFDEAKTTDKSIKSFTRSSDLDHPLLQKLHACLGGCQGTEGWPHPRSAGQKLDPVPGFTILLAQQIALATSLPKQTLQVEARVPGPSAAPIHAGQFFTLLFVLAKGRNRPARKGQPPTLCKACHVRGSQGHQLQGPGHEIRIRFRQGNGASQEL